MSDDVALPLQFTDAAANKVKSLIADEDNPNLKLRVITGVGGGIIRDVLAREIPMILRTEIYATACIIGGIVHATAFYTFSVPLESASMMGMVVTLFIRLAAIRWHLKLPTFALDENGR